MGIREKLYTVEEFEAIADAPENTDRLLELIDGELVEKVTTEEHGMITGNLYVPLWTFVTTNRLGRVVIEARHRMPDDPHNARQPDLSFRAGLTPLVKQGAIPQMPDLAVEVKSPSNTLRELREKARYYLANGTRLVWLILTENQLVEVYTPAEEFILGINDTLTGGDLLPGFTLPVRAIFTDPAAE